MVHSLREGLIDTEGYEFTFTAADIQELNEKARHGVYDVTAISIAAYPALQADYLMMPVGASIGDAFGPAIIVRTDSGYSDPAQLAGKRIAVPGRQTSAFFAARGLIGAFEEQPMHFMKIGPAVAAGEVEAGLLIHELQIDCERYGFRKLGDLGSLWGQRFALPLPLGANAVHRRLGPKATSDVTRLMRASIEYGLSTRAETLRNALQASKADLDLKLGDQYISMYVNHRSLAFEADVREAMRRLFAIGAREGLCPPCDVAHAFVPAAPTA
jgi:1,4-dihydroxy-6-naphthoate synthase